MTSKRFTPAPKSPRAFDLTKVYEQLEYEMKLVLLYRLLSGTRFWNPVWVPPFGAPVYKYVAFAGAEVFAGAQIYNFDRRVAL